MEDVEPIVVPGLSDSIQQWMEAFCVRLHYRIVIRGALLVWGLPPSVAQMFASTICPPTGIGPPFPHMSRHIDTAQLPSPPRPRPLPPSYPPSLSPTAGTPSRRRAEPGWSRVSVVWVKDAMG